MISELNENLKYIIDSATVYADIIEGLEYLKDLNLIDNYVIDYLNNEISLIALPSLEVIYVSMSKSRS